MANPSSTIAKSEVVGEVPPPLVGEAKSRADLKIHAIYRDSVQKMLKKGKLADPRYLRLLGDFTAIREGIISYSQMNNIPLPKPGDRAGLATAVLEKMTPEAIDIHFSERSRLAKEERENMIACNTRSLRLPGQAYPEEGVQLVILGGESSAIQAGRLSSQVPDAK